MDVRCAVLGPLDVMVDGATVAIASALQRRLVLRLLVTPGAPVSADALAEALWGDDLPKNPANAVRFHVWKLRAAIGEFGESILATTDAGYRLDPAVVRDVDEFTDLVAAGRGATTTAPDQAVADLRRALEMWRGRPYTEAEDAAFAQPEIRRLEEVRALADESLLAARLQLGEHEAVIADLERAVAADPLRESLWGMLMTALARSGRQADALRAYQRARRILGEELGIEPTAELRAIEDQVLRQSVSGPDRRTAGEVHNLPAPVSSFLGREHDVVALSALLVDHRLVTIVGAGGAGKTRLAVETGRAAVGAYPDGVWLVDLTDLGPGADLGAAMAAAVGLAAVGDDAATWSAAVRRFLRSRRALVIVDNCEHVLGQIAPELSDLLHAAPELSILATSRSRLSIAGERVFPIPALGLPDAAAGPLTWDVVESSPACRLFIDRARAAGADLDAMSGASPALIADLCAHLDGLPLAIELAAARSRTVELPEMHAMLEDRFRLLTSRRSDDPRHSTMAATIEWSYGLLTKREAEAFDALGAFRGSFDLEAVAALLGGGDG